MAEGLEQIARLPDPVGAITELRERPSGIRVGRMRVPLGVIGIIYESRPNVTADAAALCLKSGNAAHPARRLRGAALEPRDRRLRARGPATRPGCREAAVQVIETTDRAAVGELLRMNEYVDIIVPRGGKGLIERVMDESRIPMIKHLDGVCHVYIDDARRPARRRSASPTTPRRSATAPATPWRRCSSPQASPAQVLPPLAKIYLGKGVELRGDERVARARARHQARDRAGLVHRVPRADPRGARGEGHRRRRWTHIAKYGSQHTDAIVTEDEARAQRFLREVDSSSVMVNASTRFADGFEYGLGAEVGISTDKLHARGPVGLEGLTSQKYVVLGDGQIRT